MAEHLGLFIESKLSLHRRVRFSILQHDQSLFGIDLSYPLGFFLISLRPSCRCDHPATRINLMTESKTGCNSIKTFQDATRRFITGSVSVDTFLVRLVAEAAI